MNFLKLFAVITLLVVGVSFGFYLANAQHDAVTGDSVQLADQINSFNPFTQVTPKESPMDRIPENAISVYHDRIVLGIQDAQWATFTDTHSMEPVIMKGSNALELTPKNEDDLKVGDIVSYKSEYAEGSILHRIVYKGTDEEGTYFIMKGDNLPTSDPGRIRFSQIQRVVVAIIY